MVNWLPLISHPGFNEISANSSNYYKVWPGKPCTWNMPGMLLSSKHASKIHLPNLRVLLLFAQQELCQLFFFSLLALDFPGNCFNTVNTGQFISSETSHKETRKCVYLSFHQSLVFQSNIVAFNMWCRGLFLYYLLFSEIKQVNFTKTMRDLLNTENLSQLTQQSADVSEPILIIFTSF